MHVCACERIFVRPVPKIQTRPLFWSPGETIATRGFFVFSFIVSRRLRIPYNELVIMITARFHWTLECWSIKTLNHIFRIFTYSRYIYMISFINGGNQVAAHNFHCILAPSSVWDVCARTRDRSSTHKFRFWSVTLWFIKPTNHPKK